MPGERVEKCLEEQPDGLGIDPEDEEAQAIAGQIEPGPEQHQPPDVAPGFHAITSCSSVCNNCEKRESGSLSNFCCSPNSRTRPCSSTRILFARIIVVR